jgi:acyl carrier protein
MRERIKEVIKSTFELEDVPDSISQNNCTTWDSMHHLMLVVALETEFGISFEPEDISYMSSLDAIETKIKSII